jgi:hypothetical protein
MTFRTAHRAFAAALALSAAAPGAAEPSGCRGHPCCRREAPEAPALERAGCCAMESAPEREAPATPALVAPAAGPALPALAARPAPAVAPAAGASLPDGLPRATGPPLRLRLGSLLC